MGSTVNFINDYWGKENIVAPIANSTGWQLLHEAYLYRSNSTLPFSTWTMQSVIPEAKARKEFVETWFVASSLTMFKVIEALFWTVISCLAATVGKKEEPLNLAKRAVVELVSNSVCTLIALAGIIMPTWGVLGHDKLLAFADTTAGTLSVTTLTQQLYSQPQRSLSSA